MPKFLLVENSQPKMIVEAPSALDARLWAGRNGHAGAQIESYDEAAEQRTQEQLRESFRSLGLTEEGAKIATAGRNPAPALQTVRVPRQEPDPRLLGQGKDQSLRERGTRPGTGDSQTVELREFTGQRGKRKQGGK